MFWFGLVLFVLVGGELGAVSDGAFGLTDGPAAVVELVVGANLVPWTGLGAGGAFVAGHRKRLGLGVAGPTVPAAARIEASRAVGAGPDFPVELDLTVAPEGRAAFRVRAKTSVNLLELDRVQVGRLVVVDYEPEQPWRVTVRSDPGAEWVERIALADVATAEEGTRTFEPKVPASRRGKWYVLAAMAVGYALWWVLF